MTNENKSRYSKGKTKEKAFECMQLLKDTDFERFGIDPYSLEYIGKSKEVLESLFELYADTLLLLDKKSAIDLSRYIVDFGGGVGLLSLFLNYIGYKVVYCDRDPLAVKTVGILKKELGFGPDHIVEGTSLELSKFCSRHRLKPAYLIGIDLIEHIYDLNRFFFDLYNINPSFRMVFSTLANPCNPDCVKKLRQLMIEVERKYYLPMRKSFLDERYPQLPENEKNWLAENSRGLIYDDIEEYVERYIGNDTLLPRTFDPYNTCDPGSGSWMERLVSIRDYTAVLKDNGFKATFKGNYYEERKTFFSRFIRQLIKYTGRAGLRFASCFFLLVSPG